MRIIIVDDDQIVVQSLKMIIEATSDIKVLATGFDGCEAVGLYEKFKPDVALMDIRMKNMSGLEAGKTILSKHKDAKILFLTTFDTDEYIVEALKMGAKGYILKQNFESIVLALQMVMVNGRVFGDDIMKKVPIKNTNTFDNQKYSLNEKEIEIIKLVANGNSNKEISASLFLGEGTVRNYLSAILEKLDLRDRTQLAVFYYKNMV